jgi:hypothetical protein
VILQICRYSIAFVWIYQGLVPKLLGVHPDELQMGLALGLSASQAQLLAYVGGVMEVLLGVVVLVFYQYRLPYIATIGGLVGLWLLTVIFAPQFVVAAFNSTTVNAAVCALAGVALVELRRL